MRVTGFIVVVLALSCNSASPHCESAQTIRGTLQSVTGFATIVAADELPRRVRQQLGAISRSRVPVVAGLDLPDDYLLITGWEQSSDLVRIEATKGPLPHVPPGFVRLACGTRYAIVMVRVNGCWIVERSTASEC
jgi:hypothetical protein